MSPRAVAGCDGWNPGIPEAPRSLVLAAGWIRGTSSARAVIFVRPGGFCWRVGGRCDAGDRQMWVTKESIAIKRKSLSARHMPLTSWVDRARCAFIISRVRRGPDDRRSWNPHGYRGRAKTPRPEAQEGEARFKSLRWIMLIVSINLQVSYGNYIQ